MEEVRNILIRNSGGNNIWTFLLGEQRKSWKSNIKTGLNEMSLMAVRWMQAGKIVSIDGL
jgi:hypothetical protein